MYGQFFTKSHVLQNAVLQAIINTPKHCLEPCVGKGHLVQCVKSQYPDTEWTCIEYDSTLQQYENVPKPIYSDFLQQIFDTTFDTIVANPPYIQRKGKQNIYIECIKKCFYLLQNKGQMILILPSEFIRGTNASKMIQLLDYHGSIYYIYHSKREDLFDNASIDVLVLGYIKDSSYPKTILYNDVQYPYTVRNGMFHIMTHKNEVCVQDYFKVYVGMVSGCDKIFKHSNGNIDILTGNNNEIQTKERFIYTENFPTHDKIIDDYLYSHKNTLLNRRICRFHENNWWKWGAPRNKKKIEEFWGYPCIYVHTLSRQKTIAFEGTVQYFSGSLLMMIPHDTTISLQKWVSTINTNRYQFDYSGRFRITHKQLTNAMF